MSKLASKVIERWSEWADEGIMGFSDMVQRFEPFNDFVDRVLEKANELNSKNIHFPDVNIAVIFYEVPEERENDRI